MSKRRIKWQTGTYNRIDDKSGFTFKRSEMIVEEVTGKITHPMFADPEHPLDKPFEVFEDPGRID